MIFNFDKYILEVDVETTKKAYANLPLITENCNCQGCENYFFAIKSLPDRVAEFFVSFGIDIERSPEIFGFYHIDDLMYHYGGFYHIAGEIIDQKEDLYNQVNEKLWKQNSNMVINITNDFSVWFTNDCSLVPEGFPSPHFQLTISTKLPWLLERPYIDSAVKTSQIGKIITENVVLTQKKIKHTLFGKKYVFAFYSNNKVINLYVGQALYNFYKVGWTGVITYVNKRLASIR